MLALALTVPEGWLRDLLAPLGAVLLVVWSALTLESPGLRLLASSLWLLYVLKGWALMRRPRAWVRSGSRLGWLLFAWVWPGIDPRPFHRRSEMKPDGAYWFAQGFPTTAVGVAVLLGSAVTWGQVAPENLGWAGLAGLLTAIHLGYSDALSGGMRLLGFRVKRLFHDPLASRSLNDFWTLRWNRPFVEMNRILFAPLLRPFLKGTSLMMALFLISGLLHELALSFPVKAGWGGPLGYFFIQGLLMRAEKKAGVKDWPLQWARLWTWCWLLLPLPLLFHQAVREALVLPLLYHLHQLPPLSSVESLLSYALVAAGCGHFLVLCASFQVPHRLGWKEELIRLRPLNRKLLWTYGGYIVGMITALGVLTLYLRAEMMAGDKAALAVVVLALVFWGTRICIDFFYFEHSDWPEGPEFVVGHTMLTTLFVHIVLVYAGLLLWHHWPGERWVSGVYDFSGVVLVLAKTLTTT